MALDHLLKEARKARLADDYAGAITLLRAFLEVNPGSPDGESLLGLCEIESGRREGEARIVKAAETAPKNAAALLNLSILRERQGDFRNAVASANTSATLDPRSFEAWAQLGKLLGKGEKFDEAFAALQHAMAIRRDHPGVVLLYATAALETGNLDVCAEVLETADAVGVAPPETRRLRAHLLRKRGDAAALEVFAQDWLKAAPGEEEARIAISYALAEQGYFDRAAENFAPLANAPGAGPDKLAAMGRYLLGGRRLDEAAAWFKRALQADPADLDANFGLARLSMFLGKFEDAASWCRRVLAAAPDHAEAYGLLIEAMSGRISDDDLAALDRALASAARREADRIKLLFAKGDALHARKQHDGAFDAWAEANRLKRSRARAAGTGYDRRAQEKKTEAIIRLFPAPAKGGADGAGPTPIFIVGMPRSGTTLLESAICAHPEVDGAGEVPAMPFYLDQLLAATEQSAGVPEAQYAQWRKGYLDQCKRFGWGGARFVADKQPSNVFSVGLAARLFPAARFIHIRRNPVETGLSIHRRHFTQAWPFTTDLVDVAHYYAEHLRIAEHWATAFADRFAFVQYEDLVGSFEPEMRRLIAFCGLEWNAACLSFEEQDRAVMTFSAAQVREGLTSSRLSSAGPYRKRLAPLIDAFDALGVDLETGARRRTG